MKKAPTFLTIAAIAIGILIVASNYYLPSTDAPSIRLTLHDADGTKLVSVGETAEYVIRVENTGKSRGYLSLSKQGEAEGWSSSLSHTTLHLPPGDHQLISLFVTPESTDAVLSIDVNVIASRSDNVTIVSTTTILTTDVFIKKSGETEWNSFQEGVDALEEGDDLKTEAGGYAQFNFPGTVLFNLFPNSQIHIRFANRQDENATFNFFLEQGTASFYVKLLKPGSVFTLNAANGVMVEISTVSTTMVFEAQSNGDVRVLDGYVQYYTPQTRQGDGDGFKNITAGEDSSGETFNYITLLYPKTMVSAIVKNVKGDSIGFDNSGEFVANGDLDGFVFRIEEEDIFYVYGLDIESLTIELSRLQAGTFDLVYSRYDPDLSGFVFRNMDTPSKGTVFFKFKEDHVYLRSESEIHYDFEIRYMETDRFYLDDMILREGQGNSYLILNYVHLENDEVNSVLFGLDEDGDGTNDDEVMIHTDMTGKQVYKDMEEDEESSIFMVVAVALVIIFLIVGMYFVLLMGEKGKGGGPPESFIGIEEREDDVTDVKEPESAMDEEPESAMDEGPETAMDEEPEAKMDEMPETTMDEGSEEHGKTVAEELVEMKKERLLEEEYEQLPDEVPDESFEAPSAEIEVPSEFLPEPASSPDDLTPEEESLPPSEPGVQKTDTKFAEEPVEEGDEIFRDIEENLFGEMDTEPVIQNRVLEKKRVEDEAPPEDERSLADEEIEEGGEDEEEEEPRALTQEEINRGLNQVRELKKEMEEIETESKDEVWWVQWNNNIKKQMDELLEKED